MIAVPSLIVGSALCLACAFYPYERRHAETFALVCGLLGALLIAVGLWRLS